MKILLNARAILLNLKYKQGLRDLVPRKRKVLQGLTGHVIAETRCLPPV